MQKIIRMIAATLLLSAAGATPVLASVGAVPYCSPNSTVCTSRPAGTQPSK